MQRTHSHPQSRDTLIDPVCGMTVSADTPHHATHAGRDFRFCSAACRKKFEADPEHYLRRTTEAPESPGPSDGMAPLVRPTARKTPANPQPTHAHAAPRARSWRDYLPLLILTSLAALAAAAIQAGDAAGWDWAGWMHRFMGLFLVLFAMFKLFNLSGFADGFQMYDLLAKPLRPYAYLYPFLELGLGLGYLAAWQLPFIYGATIGLMAFGAIGVARALRRGLNIDCACMGTVLKVPLSTVALVEDLGMAAMAAAMWLAA